MGGCVLDICVVDFIRAIKILIGRLFMVRLCFMMEMVNEVAVLAPEGCKINKVVLFVSVFLIIHLIGFVINTYFYVKIMYVCVIKLGKNMKTCTQ